MVRSANTYYDILGVSAECAAIEIRTAFRSLARKYHPDTNPQDPAAEEMFKKVNEAYQVLNDPETRSRYDRTGSARPVVLSSKKDSYELERLLFRGDVADLHFARSVSTGQSLIVKVARSPSDNDLLENETRVLRAIRPPRADDEPHHRYFPRLVDSMMVEDGTGRRRANVLSFLKSFHSVEAVRTAFPAGVRLEHAVWMFNRTLEALDALHLRHGLIHGAIVPPHIVVYSGSAPRDPLTHAGALVGWSSAVVAGDRVKAISPRHERFYAPEILRKQPVSPETDIYMAAKCALFSLGIPPESDATPAHVPEYLARFLRGCAVGNQRARPGDAWALHEELESHLAKHFGPKQYVPFDMPVRA